MGKILPMINHNGRSEEVVRAWNRCHGAFYQVHESDLLWNQSQQALVAYKSDELNGVPVLWAEPAAEGIELGIQPKGLWLSLYGEIPAGQEAVFAGAVEKFARSEGRTRIAISGDEFHFLPGIPVDDERGERLVEAFRSLKFNVADCADFVGELGNPSAAAYVEGARRDASGRGWTLRLVESEQDKEELSIFLAREFKGRWEREWKIWGKRTDTGRAFWNLLRDEEGKVLGFSRLAVRSRIKPASVGWTPGAIRLPLEAGGLRDTDSCLGPIGISASERGRGAGKILLGLSLHELSLQGAKRTCIDWTNAYNYYAPLGFQVVRKFFTVWKDL